MGMKKILINSSTKTPIVLNNKVLVSPNEPQKAFKDAENRIITINNNIIKILSSVKMPSKGDLITMNLGNIEPAAGIQDLYRVLKVRGDIAFVMAMYDQEIDNKYDAKCATTSFGILTGLKYADSELDTYLNTTFYSSLTDEAKNAIVKKNIVQSICKYYDSPNEKDEMTYSYKYQYGWDPNDYDNYQNVNSILVGSRYIYALDVADIFDYINPISSQDLMIMFYNTTGYSPNVLTSPWLRSVSAEWSHSALYVNSSIGGVYDRGGDLSGGAIRPAFAIDLSKIDFELQS